MTPPATSRDLGARLKAIRQREGLTMCELARNTGLPESTLYRVEQGKGLTAHTLRLICLAVPCSADELLGLPERQQA